MPPPDATNVGGPLEYVLFEEPCSHSQDNSQAEELPPLSTKRTNKIDLDSNSPKRARHSESSLEEDKNKEDENVTIKLELQKMNEKLRNELAAALAAKQAAEAKGMEEINVLKEDNGKLQGLLKQETEKSTELEKQASESLKFQNLAQDMKIKLDESCKALERSKVASDKLCSELARKSEDINVLQNKLMDKEKEVSKITEMNSTLQFQIDEFGTKLATSVQAENDASEKLSMLTSEHDEAVNRNGVLQRQLDSLLADKEEVDRHSAQVAQENTILGEKVRALEQQLNDQKLQFQLRALKGDDLREKEMVGKDCLITIIEKSMQTARAVKAQSNACFDSIFDELLEVSKAVAAVGTNSRDTHTADLIAPTQVAVLNGVIGTMLPPNTAILQPTPKENCTETVKAQVDDALLGIDDLIDEIDTNELARQLFNTQQPQLVKDAQMAEGDQDAAVEEGPDDVQDLQVPVPEQLEEEQEGDGNENEDASNAQDSIVPTSQQQLKSSMNRGSADLDGCYNLE